MRFVNNEALAQELATRIYFGRYSRAGRHYFIIPETIEELKAIVEFEIQLKFKNTNMLSPMKLNEDNYAEIAQSVCDICHRQFYEFSYDLYLIQAHRTYCNGWFIKQIPKTAIRSIIDL